MGMIRKLSSMSTAGLVSFNSPREKHAKAALMNARTARAAQVHQADVPAPDLKTAWADLKRTVKGK